jgi:cell division septation protein DedD
VTDDDRETLPLQDEDRLPWLEAVDDNIQDDTVSTGKLIGFGVAALAAIGIVIGGVSVLRSAPGPAKGDGKLIAAQEGDYKVRPDAPGGMKVEGQGDSSFAASEGAEANGKIDTNAASETPVKGTKVPLPKPGFSGAPAKPVATASVPASGGKLVAPLPAKPVQNAAMTAASGSLVQLGAFGSEAKANEAWTSMAKRFGYLSALPKSVIVAQVNGNQVYRLRANAGGQASTICGKLKVAGENCMIVN